MLHPLVDMQRNTICIVYYWFVGRVVDDGTCFANCLASTFCFFLTEYFLQSLLGHLCIVYVIAVLIVMLPIGCSCDTTVCRLCLRRCQTDLGLDILEYPIALFGWETNWENPVNYFLNLVLFLFIVFFFSLHSLLCRGFAEDWTSYLFISHIYFSCHIFSCSTE